MSMLSRISLDQWRSFVATVEQGGFLQAAEKLNKTQSAVSHAVKKMEFLLGKDLFQIEGRKAVLTSLGQALLPHAKQLLGEAEKIERLAHHHQPGVFAELAVAVDMLFPAELLDFALAQFSETFVNHRVRLFETSLSGTGELLEDGKVELGIAAQLPPGHIQEALLTVPLVCVISGGHALAAQAADLTLDELKAYRQIVIRDSGARQAKNSGWLGTSQRWTVSSTGTALRMVEGGHGFAWLPESVVRSRLASGHLLKVPLKHQARREVALQMGYTESRIQEPAVRGFADIVRGLCAHERSGLARFAI